jgi:hypothetical protein
MMEANTPFVSTKGMFTALPFPVLIEKMDVLEISVDELVFQWILPEPVEPSSTHPWFNMIRWECMRRRCDLLGVAMTK